MTGGPDGLTVTAQAGHYQAAFRAMASPCEVLVDTASATVARAVGTAVAQCAWRIECKFSRYRDDSIVQKINTAAGQPVQVDDETARLLNFAHTLYQLSDGLFDITSGVLRRAWTFDGSDRLPTAGDVAALLPAVGWSRVQWNNPTITLPAGMEIDFGGIGKEYAVDMACAASRTVTDAACLVNFGGDLAVCGERRDGAPWRAGIEAASHDPSPPAAAKLIALSAGALATSGDARRYLKRDGVRYSHVLDPRSGWPVANAPQSVTVAAATCAQAGMLATLAMLHGAGAEKFLTEQAGSFWVQRNP